MGQKLSIEMLMQQFKLLVLAEHELETQDL